MTDYYVKCVKIENVRKHPNADKLEIVTVLGAYECVTQIGRFKDGDLAVYISEDALVDVRDLRFAFLLPEPVLRENESETDFAARVQKWTRTREKRQRIRAIKLRGVFSLGVLLTAAEVDSKLKEGDECAERLNITKYDPDSALEAVQSARAVRHKSRAHYYFWRVLMWYRVFFGYTKSFGGPKDLPHWLPTYGVTSLRRAPNMFAEGDIVNISEKTHGSCSSYGWLDGQFYVMSHHTQRPRPHTETQEEFQSWQLAMRKWRRQKALWFVGRVFGMPKPEMPKRTPTSDECMWWRVAREYNFEALTKDLGDGMFICGEVYGAQKGFPYDTTPDRPYKFVAFDIYSVKESCYLPMIRWQLPLEIPVVPQIYNGPWSEELKKLSDGRTKLGGKHTREGIVIRTPDGLKVAKFVGQTYLLERAKQDESS